MGSLIDLAGKRFGRWTVIEKSDRISNDKYDRYWTCVCECGAVRDVLERSLMRGQSCSCGCSRNGRFETKVSRTDKGLIMIGHRFGRWTVESRADDYVTKFGDRFDQWNCVCDCGTRRVVSGGNLIRGRTKSCGCYKEEAAQARGKEQRIKAKYRSIGKDFTYNDILNFVLDDEPTDTETAVRKALRIMFPVYWQKKVRDEQTILRRYAKEHPFCDMCGMPCKPEMHHIRPVSDFGGNEEENIMWLCHKCHSKTRKDG